MVKLALEMILSFGEKSCHDGDSSADGHCSSRQEVIMMVMGVVMVAVSH